MLFQRKNNSAREKEMSLTLMKSEDRLRSLVRANQELDMDIEDHKDKIKEWYVLQGDLMNECQVVS